MIKNQKGFTLVEVIVVAVIVAVLAAVAIPLYNGYIRDSRLNVANNIAGSVASACGATKQQDPSLLPADGDYDATTPVVINSVSDGAATQNTINIPTDFTVTIAIAAATVQAFYKLGDATAQIDGDLFNF